MTNFGFGKKVYHKQPVILGLLLSLTAVILLTGCGIVIAYSPDAAVAQEVLKNRMMPDMQIKADTLRILQKQPVGKMMLVLISFRASNSNTGESDCLFTYEVSRTALGSWQMGGGGGGCASVQNPDPSPITVGGGIGSGSSGRPGDPGYCTVSGLVRQKDIRSIIVTWQDDTTQTGEVINDSFLIGRTGMMGYKKVEALNDKKEVVFTSEVEVAPEKQPQEVERELSEPTKDANP